MKLSSRIVAAVVSTIAILSTLVAAPAYAATAPDPPTNFQITAGVGQLSMTWSAPANDGGSPITTYFVTGYVTSAGPTTSEIANVGNVTSFVWDTTTPIGTMNLVPGTNYTFRVEAFNAIGQSLLSNNASATPLGLPGAPTGLNAAAGNAQVPLGWTAPSNTGGTVITDYLIEYSSDGGGTWSIFSHGASASTTATVTGLTNGTAYTFRVSAISSVGTGAASATASATPAVSASVPAAPTGLNATAGDTQASLSWTAPFSDGGAAITDYLIEYSSDGGGTWSTFIHAASTATTATVTGLTNGTSYMFRVSAINSVGTGAVSSTASATPATVPGAPTGLNSVPGDGQVALSWTAPTSDGGSPITGYTVAMSTDGGATFFQTMSVGNSTTATWTGITNGASYVFMVAASNSGGTGAYSATTQASPVALPGAPTNLIGSPGNGQAFLSWTAPASDGGSVITDYMVESSSDAGATWTPFAHTPSSATVSTVTGLTNGTTYTFRVSAVNSVGTGSPSTTMQSRPAIGLSGCPTASTPFTDIAGSFAEADVACIYALGITTGTSATTYSPANFVTREQMAAFLARTWRALGQTCSTASTPFTDIAGSFAEADVACIYALGITTGTSATTYSPANFVTREQMAAFLARTVRFYGD